MRVGILSLLHESNTFISTPTTLESFQSDRILTGNEIARAYEGGHHEVSGFLEGLSDQGIEAVPIFFAKTNPSGRITKETCDSLMEMMFTVLDEAGPLDGVLAAPHGANVGEGEEYSDLDGHWLSRLRTVVGTGCPIVCTIDPHTNLSSRMVEACDATIAYRSNPHMDQKKVGLQATRLIARTLGGEVRPAQSAAFPPVAINIERQLTSARPCLPLYEMADEFLRMDKVLSNSIVLGFPYADVREMGSATIVVTDDAPDLATELADRLADYMVEHRHEFAGKFISPEEGVRKASRSAGPVCLLDMGDNVGGGSAADGTTLLHEMARAGNGKAFVCLYDRESQDLAREAGIGAELSLVMGGKTDALHGEPFEATVRVRSLHDGKFHEPEVRHGGQAEFDMGPTAVVETGHGLTISLTSRRTVPVSLGVMTSLGLEPSDFQIIVAKGVHSPVAGFAPVCKSMIRVDTPGATAADMRRFEFHRRRRPLYPFEEIV